MKQVWLLDKDNYWTGEFDWVEEVKTGMTDVPLINKFVKSQLVNGKWVEGATDEEILEWEVEQIDICTNPTDQERIAKLEEEKSILAENLYQLANIIESILGDENNG